MNVIMNMKINVDGVMVAIKINQPLLWTITVRVILMNSSPTEVEVPAVRPEATPSFRV